MEKGNNAAASLNSNKPERKVIEKNRRNQMKFLYSQLFSLLPDHVISKGCTQMSDGVNDAIKYIESLKTNLKNSKDKKEKLLSRKRLHEYTASDNHRASTSHLLNIQIHEMGPDIDVVLIAGLKNQSVFVDIIRVLDQYSTEVVHANFCTSGPSIFHVHNKKIEAAEICRRLNELFGGYSKNEELDVHAPSFKEEEANLDLWDFEICSEVWFETS